MPSTSCFAKSNGSEYLKILWHGHMKAFLFTLLNLTQAPKHKMTTRMSGFVQHCVITKECPETFVCFLYKSPLFPRLVQVLRICFLSHSFFPSSVCLWRHMNSTKGWFTAAPQCKFSVFKGAKGELRVLSAGKISRLRSSVISNQTALWKQTHGRSRVEWTFEVQTVLRNFLFSDTFVTNERLFSSFGKKVNGDKPQANCSPGTVLCVFTCFLAASVWCLC